jgi:hypothetical protein
MLTDGPTYAASFAAPERARLERRKSRLVELSFDDDGCAGCVAGEHAGPRDRLRQKTSPAVRKPVAAAKDDDDERHSDER